MCQKACEYSEFNRTVARGVPKFPGEMAMQRDAYSPKGMPSFVGKLDWGCQNSYKIFRDSFLL